MAVLGHGELLLNSIFSGVVAQTRLFWKGNLLRTKQSKVVSCFCRDIGSVRSTNLGSSAAKIHINMPRTRISA